MPDVEKDRKPNTASGKLRIDKWLWFARIVKTRSRAQKLISARKVRLNGDKIKAPSQVVKSGDALTITLERQIKVLQIVELGVRRGPAPEAQALYLDLSPPPEKKTISFKPAKQGIRDAGAGRPTKKDRRTIDRFLTREDNEL